MIGLNRLDLARGLSWTFEEWREKQSDGSVLVTAYLVPPVTYGTRRPRWKYRQVLGTFAVAPMSTHVVHPGIWKGMRRLHVQSVKMRGGWVRAVYWGKP